jgi:hypothetical protein
MAHADQAFACVCMQYRLHSRCSSSRFYLEAKVADALARHHHTVIHKVASTLLFTADVHVIHNHLPYAGKRRESQGGVVGQNLGANALLNVD